LGDGGVVREGSLTFSSSKYAISVDMEQWTAEHRAFIVETFFKTGDSVTLTQWRFCVRFNVGRHAKVPSRNTILLWMITNFRLTGTALKKKAPTGARTIWTPENVETVRRAGVTSLCCSATKHAIALAFQIGV
jgi:hypothetical protein